MQGLPHVVVYVDDILVTGSTEEEHLRTLEEVLDRLEKAGARLKREKCRFMLPMVEYLGHRISADGLQPTDTKIKALKQAPIPRNVTQLKAFLGLLNYYGKFVPICSPPFTGYYGRLLPGFGALISRRRLTRPSKR